MFYGYCLTLLTVEKRKGGWRGAVGGEGVGGGEGVVGKGDRNEGKM